MKDQPISVHAINATIVLDATPTGRTKYTINLDKNAGTAIDRIQICHDYRLPLSDKHHSTLTDQNIFKCGNAYITFSMLPKSSDSVYLLTCRCEHAELGLDESIELVKAGMEKALRKLAS